MGNLNFRAKEPFWNWVRILFGYATYLTSENITWDFDGVEIACDDAQALLFKNTSSQSIYLLAKASDDCPSCQHGALMLLITPTPFRSL